MIFFIFQLMVIKMKIAVVGLGTEGNLTLHSLLNYGHQIYASDQKKDLKITVNNFEGMYEIDLGCHNWKKINETDAIVISPSLWKPKILKRITDKSRIFSEVFREHRDIYTIGVTGTNGKTTTVLMIKEVLEKAGFNVLVGGNAGGGFEGYTKLMLEASQDSYDYLIVEVCDMTLDFCSYNFDFNLMVVTNLGYDHINVHHTITQYRESIRDFIKNKKVILNKNDELLFSLGENLQESLGKNLQEVTFFDSYSGKLNLIGKFNRQNAAAAAQVAEILDIPEKMIKKSLASFKAVTGRITELNLDGTSIVIGKTDNVSAIAAVFQELKFDAVILGTPRESEYWRFYIFKEVTHYNPQFVGLFPGLDNTTIQAEEVLKRNRYPGHIKIFNNILEVTDFIMGHYKNFKTIFVGGNGQKKITELKKILKEEIS